MSTDWWGVEEPEWYRLLRANTPEGKIPEYVKIGLDEFCGRFDLTPGKAKSEIRRCQLWNCGVHPVRNFPVRFRKPDEIGKDPFEIPLPEADRYAAIIAAEKPINPIEHPLFDTTDNFHSKRLAIAVRAWEYARSKKPAPTKSNFLKRVDSFLDSQGIEGNERARIREICNPSPRGPSSRKIL